jgi:tyrosine-protein kinase Etk/Wzc
VFAILTTISINNGRICWNVATVSIYYIMNPCGRFLRQGNWTLMIPDTSSTEKLSSSQKNSSSESGWSILDLLTTLARKRKFILLTTFGVAVVTAATTLLLPVRYTAAASILPPQQSTSPGGLLSQMTGGSGLAALAGSSLGIKSPIDMYIAMFRSRTVEDAMIKRFDLMKAYRKKKLSEAREKFETRSTAVAGVKDGVIRVTVDGSTPEKAAELTNAYVDEFQKLASTVAVTEAAQRRLFFDHQLEEAKNNLSTAEQDLKRTELTTGMLQPDSESRAMIESAAVIQGQIAAKEVQLQGMSAFATDNNPDVVTVKRQLDELRAQLGRFTGNASSGADLFVPKGKVPEAALDFVRKLREVKYRETIFQALAAQYQLAKLDEAKQGAVFQTIDVAVPPDRRSFPHRTILVIVFTLLSFIFACFAAWAGAAYDALREDPEDGPKIVTLLAALRRPQA